MTVPSNRQGALNPPFYRYSLFAYLLTIFVIGWGAFVRATHSGAGCGKHWPMCNGEVMPMAPSLETVIEFTHRTTSGLSAIVVFLLWWLFGRRSINPLLKKLTIAALAFMGVEVMVGAFLVLFGWVKNDTSGIRAVVIAIHLVNSFLLLASLNGVVALSSKATQFGSVVFSKKQFCIIALFLMTGSFGAITALGDTLFPATSLSVGLRQDFALNSHFLLQLRVLHPIIACVTSYLMFQYGLEALEHGTQRNLAIGLLFSTVLQVAIGIFAITFLAPIYLQMLHLAGAMVVWHFLVQLVISQGTGEPSSAGF